ncbi:MAG: EamA family transporter RarD [Frankiaceae bacterium]|nr:EamA family transporter RarD [Frankiaceae bacterium]MBV9872967.1 EamA family transporter RarD [Frankiaceae bacterium]
MSEGRRGILFGLGAYLIWGAFPLYWPLLEPGGAMEILAHRVIWSLVAVVAVLTVSHAWRRLPRGRRELRLLAIAAVMIGINWGVYIWGVNHHHVVETSLGYFVNPLVTVALSVLILGERLRRVQWAAVGVAAVGVVILTVDTGRPPWIALVLATSFGCYGLIKKVVGVEPAAGLAVETVVLTPVAAGYLIWLGVAGEATFASHGIGHPFLLASAGPVTAVPLLLFAGAASRIPLSTIGLMQYLTPSIQFVIGVTIRHEPLGTMRLVGFVFVWLSLIVFTVDSMARRGVADPGTATLPAMEPV